ncbi:MAG: cation:proton antiporter [Spirochaetes bacterium]|nr:cation:proton antiporter [Spirochaetota bacterium]MBN2769605.1 cation:proton antiporter [Spirochaetota bacterium]
MRLLTIFLYLIPSMAFASQDTHSANITHMMTKLVFEIGVIIFAAKLGGMTAEKLKMPSVLGELIAGIIIGPYALGIIVFPGFPDGLFPISTATALPVSPELYGFATIASIILLFAAGLETDFTLFLKYSVTGLVLGIGGVIVSFALGALTTAFFMNVSFMSPQALFLGVMSTATSVGITARILSERRKMDSPEGVSIMAGAVIDDILGIIILAIVLGISAAATRSSGNSVDWSNIAFVAIKAIGVWVFFTFLGIVFAYKISRFLKMFKSVSTFSVMSLGLAFILAGIFEKAGLAMIVGAYVMGLSLSRTDLSFVIHDKLHTIQLFLVPIFFTVMGMLVNPATLFSREVLLFGAVYTTGAVAAKIIGCGIPSLILRFNKLGSLRIGLGMVPRGEVALIIAGIGLSYGILDNTMFGVGIMMTLLTTLIAPPLLNLSLKSDKSGTRKQIEKSNQVTTTFATPSASLTKIIEDRILENFHEEGFFINLIVTNVNNYHLKKDAINITLTVSRFVIEFKTDEADLPFVKNVIYETLLNFKTAITEVQSIVDSLDMRNEIVGKGRTNKSEVRKHLKHSNIIIGLESNTKEGVIKELVSVFKDFKDIGDPRDIISALLEREKVMSTGLADGIAIPHAKTEQVKSIQLVIGLAPDGVDFESLDGKPSKIFFLILSPLNESSSHLQMMSNITSIFYEKANRKELLSCSDTQSIMDFFSK